MTTLDGEARARTDGDTAKAPTQPDVEVVVRAAPWWVLLVAGVMWLVYAWIVLSFDITTVWAIVLFAGFMFLGIGITELAVATMVREWRWWHIALGLIGIGAGVIAFVWPDETFLTLAGLLAWFLLFKGTLDIVMSLMTRREDDVWWLSLIVGIAELAVGFWAIGYAGRAIALLVLWVGFIALFKGITDIMLAFQLRSLSRS